MSRSTLFSMLAAALLIGCSNPEASGEQEPLIATVPAPTQSIVEIAAGDESFSTLVAALQAADLIGALEAEGPFTVFAPVNDAFAGLAAGELDRLLQPENVDELRDVLTYHVVSGSLDAAAVSSASSLTALNGNALQVTVQEDRVLINDAPVISTDIMATNGVIHVIDGILMEW